MALLERDLRREPRAGTTRSRTTTTPRRRSSSSPGASTSRSPGTAAAALVCTGNSFATPHIAGHCRRSSCQAPGADAVPAEERPLPDGDERGRWRSERTSCGRAVRGRRARLGRAVTGRCCSRSSTWPGRSSRRKAASIFLLDDRDGRARLRSCGATGVGVARRPALSVEHRHRRLRPRQPRSRS